VEGLLRFDLESFKAINIGLHKDWLDPIFTVITYTGLGITCTIGALLLLVWRSTRAYVAPLLLALAIGGWGLADGIKPIVGRERPSNLPFALPQEPLRLSSFPSGHTADAFSMAFMLLFLTWGTPRAKWGWLALVWAALVGFSRVYRGVHWPSDVLAGAMCGLVAACIASLIWARIGDRFNPKASFS